MESKSIFLLTENDVNPSTIGQIKESNNCIVYPLTFKTIGILKENKIKYELFDELLAPKDYERIDNEVYHIGRTWSENIKLAEIFDYENVNISKMIERELIVSLLKFGYRISILEKIFSKVKPKIVYTSETTKSISKIPRLFSKKHQFIIKNINSKSEEKSFRHDNITVGFVIKGKNLDFRISRKNFLKIKKYYELFWKLCYKISSKEKRKKTGPKILLLDFNLGTNKTTLENLSQSEFQILLANTRRPVIWNYESLKIAKKINFSNIQLDLENSNLNPKLKDILEKFENFIYNNNFFTKKFKIEGISFWGIFEEDFKVFCKERFSEIISFINSLNNFLEKEEVELLITLDEAQQIERAATVVCKNRKIKTLLLRNTDINIFKDGKRNWEVFTLKKIYSDKFAIYGDLSKEICLNHGLDSEKLVLTGNPRYDELFKRKSCNDEKYILITLSGIASTAWTTFYSSSLVLKYERMFKEILKALAKLDKKIIIKMHPTQDPIFNALKIVNEILPKAIILKNANTYDLISHSEIVISSPSSVITEALILDKPLFLFKILENDSGIPYEKFNAVIATEDEADIDFKINQILFDKEIRKELDIGRKEFLKHALKYHGNSSEKIIELIRNMIHRTTN
jgi:hypothetical protein